MCQGASLTPHNGSRCGKCWVPATSPTPAHSPEEGCSDSLPRGVAPTPAQPPDPAALMPSLEAVPSPGAHAGPCWAHAYPWSAPQGKEDTGGGHTLGHPYLTASQEELHFRAPGGAAAACPARPGPALPRGLPSLTRPHHCPMASPRHCQTACHRPVPGSCSLADSHRAIRLLQINKLLKALLPLPAECTLCVQQRVSRASERWGEGSIH